MERSYNFFFVLWLGILVYLNANSRGHVQPQLAITLHPNGSNVCTYKYRVETKDNNGRSLVTYKTGYRCCDGWTKHNEFSVQCMVRTKCGGSAFACDNGNCVYNPNICDVLDHCGDGSDERMCGGCPTGYFRCSKDDMCLPRRLYCDQIPDCGGSKDEMPEDEMNCGNIVKLSGPMIKSKFGHVYSGVVNLWHNDGWGSLCDDHIDMDVARVLCRQLGFTNATQFFTQAKLGQLSPSYPVWQRALHCEGSEQSIVQCRMPFKWGVQGCRHSEDAGIECSDDTLPQIQLIGKREEEAIIP